MYLLEFCQVHTDQFVHLQNYRPLARPSLRPHLLPGSANPKSSQEQLRRQHVKASTTRPRRGCLKITQGIANQ
eukprot:m.151832 g.151832  ORF g.151832 m.151832 type:complete len:73 (+) comp15045_c1_seq2:2055-2273(+)